MLDPLSIERILRAIGNPPALPESVLAVPGFATSNLRRLLNSLCSFRDCRYLEVGTLHGASLTAAAWNHSCDKTAGMFQGIDNFSQFGGSLSTAVENVQKLLDPCGLDCVSVNEFDAATMELPNLLVPPGVNVLFYDGHHGEDVTRDVLIRFNALLADRFILIVDDWSWIGPRKGTEAAIAACGWRVELKMEINDNYNRRGWGVGVAVILAEKAK